ncbi:MAG: porin family protein [Syntrophomonadaceae bacterium]
MLKTLLLVSVLIAFQADASNAQNFSLGIKGGGSLIRMDFERPFYIYNQSKTPAEYKTAYGYTFGLSATYKFSRLISLETDMLYELKGTKHGYEQASLSGYNPTKITYIYNLNYVAIPVLAKIFLPVESPLKPHLALGTSFNFLLNSNMHYTLERDPRLNYTMEYIPSYYDLNSKTNSFDFGLIAGLGADYNLASGTISLEARYELGVANLDKGLGTGPVNNKTFSVLLGYSIRL